MANYKTPGVYIEEISTLPASIAPVATAIPVFIGYTGDHTRNKESVKNKPVRIASMLEFTEIFGGPFNEEFSVTLTGPGTGIDDTTIAITHTAVPYTLYYHVRIYFENGGGPCYIVSVAKYAATAAAAAIDKDLLKGGLDAVSKEDEVTLLVIPEAIALEDADRKDVYDAMLTQCNSLQDRFSIFDVFANPLLSVKEDGDNFRNNNIGSDYLKYGAAYYPSLKTTMNFSYDDEETGIADNRTGAAFTSGTKLFDVLNSGFATGTITIDDNTKVGRDIFIINGKLLSEPSGFTKGADNNATALALFNAITGLGDTSYKAALKNNMITFTATARGSLLSIVCTKSGGGATVSGPVLAGGADAVPAVAATGIITITDFNFIDGDSIVINGHAFTEGPDFTKDANNDSTANALCTAITAFNDPAYSAAVAANVITITAKSAGVAGNAIALSYNDGGTAALTIDPTLSGGLDGIAGIAAAGKITINDYNNIDGATFIIDDTILIGGTDFAIGKTNVQAATNLFDKLTGLAPAGYTAARSGYEITITAKTAGLAGNLIKLEYDEGGGTELTTQNKADKTLYNLITKEIKKQYVELYPGAAMAGIYARVDKDRGVWKAPANVSVNLVKDPSIQVTKEEQENLNVDATSGKSVNAIRKFTGKGTIVWGARTLAGNDNEWRYVPVRRLFIFIEESVKKATEFVVFEPNDAKTWMRAKAMIENFLTTLWRDGALAGAKPNEAFFVNIGLGVTMTSLDILEGRLNIEIGLAAVRPAEFIILKFSHKLQES